MKPRVIAKRYGMTIITVDGKLRLLDHDTSVCMGYANCCVCQDCMDRAAEPNHAPPAPRQPWDIAA